MVEKLSLGEGNNTQTMKCTRMGMINDIAYIRVRPFCLLRAWTARLKISLVPMSFRIPYVFGHYYSECAVVAEGVCHAVCGLVLPPLLRGSWFRYRR